MKYPGILVLLLAFSFAGNAQVNKKVLSAKEDSMKLNALQIIRGINPADRLGADSMFTRQLVRALKEPYSFDYRFDSLITISQLYPPDSTFRIFTWQLVISDNLVRQHGAIQMRTRDGSLKLFPLIDRSDITQNISDTIGDNTGWIGAVYYKLVQKEARGKKYYTLLGYDENNIRSNKKVIEILTFNEGKPQFGNRIFNAPDNQLIPKSISRYVMEYKKSAGPRLTYDSELDLIIMEHLVSESNQPAKKWTLIGDGDYEGFKWADGKWVYISKVFNEVTPENQPPTPMTILDAEGNIDESKLEPKD